MSENIISIPVLFDIGGDAIVFGEEAPDDFVTSHLDFVLDMTTEANDISLNAADISAAILIGDNDTNDNIFYSGGTAGNVAVDNLCNRIAKAITRGKLVHLPKSGDHSNSGIPMGGRQQLANNLGELGSSYATKYLTSIAPIGDEQMLGQAMARVASVHLVGSPLAAGIFEDKNQIQTDLETPSTQTFNDGNTAFYNALAVQLSKVLGGSKSSAPMNNGGGSGSSSGSGSGSTPDLASQVLYENFEDNAYTGDVTTATIVSGGYNSSNYALQGGGKNNYNRWRINTTTYQSVSFWYYRDSANSGSNMEAIFDNNRQTNGINSLFFKNETGHASKDKISFMSQNSVVSKLYVNGVDQSSAITTSWESSYTPITYADLTWHHFYIEFSSATNMPATFGQPDAGGDGGDYKNQYDLWGGGGKFDEVRLFNTALHTLQIADLAAGNNGNVTIPVFTLPSAVALINMDGTTHSRERNDIANIIDNDDSTWSYTTTSSTTSSHAPFILKFSFSAQDVGKTLKHLAFRSDPTDNHSLSGLKFGILNGTTYTTLNVISGTNLGTGATLTTGTVTWDNDTNWHISNYPVNQSTEVSLNDYTIQSNDHLVVRWLASTGNQHFTLRYFKFSFSSSGSSGGGTVEPYDVASSNSTLSGQTYSGSSENSYASSHSGYTHEDRFEYKHAFDNDTGIDFNHAWLSAEQKYNKDTGVYEATESTEGYTGEYVQVDIGQSIVLKSVKIFPWNITSASLEVHERDRTMATKMRLFSSVNGTNWTQIQDWDNLTVADWRVGSNFTSVDYTLNSSVTARYFRLVVNEVEGGDPGSNTAFGYAAIGEIELKGLLPSEDSSGSSTGYPLDASGVAVPALKSIYEQLMNVPGRSQIMETRDVSGVRDNSNVTLAGGFPFISGDKLVMYLRPKVVFANQTQPQQNTTLVTASGPTTTTIDVPTYDIGRKSSAGGAISGQVYTESSSHTFNADWGFHKMFEGTHTDDEDWTTQGYSDTQHHYDNSSPYNYIGTQKTTNIDGTNELLGEWGQVDIGQDTVINKFQIWPRPGRRDSRSPGSFSLLGSLDGTNWTTIKAVSGLTASDWALTNGNTPEGTITWELDSVHGPYRYYRLTVQSLLGYSDHVLSLTGLLLYGAKSPSEVTTGSTGSVSDISGLVTNIVATGQDISSAFPGKSNGGNSPEAERWGWMGSPNSDTLSLETTDVKDETICDLHIWKITITL